MENVFKLMDKDFSYESIKDLLIEGYNANGNNHGQAILGLSKLFNQEELTKLVRQFAIEFQEISKQTIDNDPMAAYMRQLTKTPEGGFDYMSSREKMCAVCLIFFDDEEVNTDVVNAVNTVAEILFADPAEPNKDTSFTQKEVVTYIQAANHRFPGETFYKKMQNNECDGKEVIIPYIRLCISLRVLAKAEIYKENQEFVDVLQKSL